MNDLEKAKSLWYHFCTEESCDGHVDCKLCPKAQVHHQLMEMAQWKDEQVKQLLIEKTKLLSSSAAQYSIRRCTIEEIYEELFNERMPNSNPYIK